MPRLNPSATSKAAKRAARTLAALRSVPAGPGAKVSSGAVAAAAEIATAEATAPPSPPPSSPLPPPPPPLKPFKVKPFKSNPTPFVPRATFEVSAQIPRSYFLGHHNAALTRMRQVLTNVGLIIECRDFRIPVSSWNPLLEQSLAAGDNRRARIIVYTKRDLAPESQQPRGGGRGRGRDALSSCLHRQNAGEVIRYLKTFHGASAHSSHAQAVLFLGTGQTHSQSLRPLLDAIKTVARNADSLTGLRAMVVGMPNAGKSTLLNRLRARGMNLGKAAKTGAEPGVTRKLGTPVRIIPGEDDGDPAHLGMGEGVFVVDTPGVFVPYVSEPEAMLKLCLVGCVKDGLVSATTIADYLLYHLNLAGSTVYVERFGLDGPTNDVHVFLRAAARRTGKLKRGNAESLEGAADWVVQEWRKGALGRFLLDEVTPDSLVAALEAAKVPSLSMNQARRKEKEERKVRNESKRLGLGGGGDGGLDTNAVREAIFKV